MLHLIAMQHAVTATAKTSDTKDLSTWEQVYTMAATEYIKLATAARREKFEAQVVALCKSTDNKIDKSKLRKLRQAAKWCVNKNSVSSAVRFVRCVRKGKYELAVKHVKSSLKPRHVHIMQNSRQEQYLEIMHETAKSSLSGKGNAPSA